MNPQIHVAIIGGGPAGLSAAITLGRARRSVAVFDDGEPRNGASSAVHCFLGSEGMSPRKLRDQARTEAGLYGIELIDSTASWIGREQDRSDRFIVRTTHVCVEAEAVLLAIGVRDELPDLPGISSCYGKSVHHCPYCDGWEHREQRLVAIGAECVELGLSLKSWSAHTSICTNGVDLSKAENELLKKAEIAVRIEAVDRLPIYLVDAALEGLLLLAWGAALLFDRSP